MEESILETKSVLYKQSFDKYRAENCNSKGKQIDDILTAQELRGIAKLSSRQKNGEIIVSETDKSQNHTVSTPESYIDQGNKHSAKDKEVSWKEFNKAKAEIQGHTCALCNVFNVGLE